ncbi:unnamed protein product [Scytosiphon promiscuus]
MCKYRVRESLGAEDYVAVIHSVDSWWGGRQVSRMLPRLFFENFCSTTFVAVRDETEGKERGQAGNELVVGFLCGFVSESRAGEAHAHFVGVAPAHRGAGLAANLYNHFFRAVRARGCTLVHAVTDPCNTSSVAFHMALGFEPQPVAVGPSGTGSREDDQAARATLKARADDEKDDGVSSGSEVSALARRPSGDVYVRSEFVHVGYDGPDDGDRVVLEKGL